MNAKNVKVEKAGGGRLGNCQMWRNSTLHDDMKVIHLQSNKLKDFHTKKCITSHSQYLGNQYYSQRYYGFSLQLVITDFHQLKEYSYTYKLITEHQ